MGGELIGGLELGLQRVELGRDRVGVDVVEIADLRLQDRQLRAIEVVGVGDAGLRRAEAASVVVIEIAP